MLCMALLVPLIVYVITLNMGVYYTAMASLYESSVKKAQRRIGQHGWDTKVGYTKGILLIRILSYCLALFRVLHLSVTSKCTLKWINKENMVLSLSEEPTATR